MSAATIVTPNFLCYLRVATWRQLLRCPRSIFESPPDVNLKACSRNYVERGRVAFIHPAPRHE